MVDYTRGPERAERGRRGGQAVREKYGSDYYARIGKKGGNATKEQRGSAYYTEIGKKGGEVMKRRWESTKTQLAALPLPMAKPSSKMRNNGC